MYPKVFRSRTGIGAVAALALLAGLGSQSAVAAPRECEAILTVALTPDIPDASDAGFLSSLLNNHPGYRLDLLQEVDPSIVELDLAGPGPDYRCDGVIETMRKDARVLSIRVESADSQVAAASAAPISTGELLGMHVSSEGIGSLYWAAQHPAQAWRVLLPVRVQGDRAGDDAG